MHDRVCSYCDKEITSDYVKGIAGSSFCNIEHYTRYLVEVLEFDLRPSNKHPVPADLATQGK